MTKYELELYVEDLFFPDNDQKSPISESQWQKWFEKWLNLVDIDFDEDKIYEISLLLTDDKEIQSLNTQFRHKNQPTDVLTFAALEADFPDHDLMDSVTLGDIIMSVETAQKQAQLQQHSLKTELAWLASHGFLHLLGWDHPDDDSLRKMLTQQEFLLNAIGLQSPAVADFFF
ncbi:metal-dependent hydrolase YbeY [Geminocystis sp. NIES-3708]|uniref:rRNA maturation RNase YbeY n=1 Tax=Geminocystis sp. NIES-3708 TaxID=1615909 RepID=UPI0005FCC9EB|nr:rRNA maturation RNase YbeY [Geminocystis sp. NIES-3708]BAQ60516.1 metal-dependent hydrolase YbeY [Geminocystis sp. NIES-3708]